MVSSVPPSPGDLGRWAQKWKMWVKLRADEDVKRREPFPRPCLLMAGLKREGRWSHSARALAKVVRAWPEPVLCPPKQ